MLLPNKIIPDFLSQSRKPSSKPYLKQEILKYIVLSNKKSSQKHIQEKTVLREAEMYNFTSH